MGKALTNTEVESLKKMALQGLTPAAISKNLGCSISTIHHYKDKLKKQEGIQFPKVKGKRPNKKSIAKRLPIISSHRRISGFTNTPVGEAQLSLTNQKSIQFIINGVSVEIATCVKSIKIQDNTICIDF